LAVTPNFGAPDDATWKFCSTNVEVEKSNGERRAFEANFVLEHFYFTDPSMPVDKRWRIVLILPKAKKEEVPIGSRVYVSETDYSKVFGNEGA
jgi:hypothetical protein